MLIHLKIVTTTEGLVSHGSPSMLIIQNLPELFHIFMDVGFSGLFLLPFCGTLMPRALKYEPLLNPKLYTKQLIKIPSKTALAKPCQCCFPAKVERVEAKMPPSCFILGCCTVGSVNQRPKTGTSFKSCSQRWKLDWSEEFRLSWVILI